MKASPSAFKKVFFAGFEDEDVCKKIEKEINLQYKIRVIISLFLSTYFVLKSFPMENIAKLLSLYAVLHFVIYFLRKFVSKDVVFNIFLMITVDIFFIALCSLYLPIQHHYIIVAIYQIVLLSNMMKYGLKFFWYSLTLILFFELSVYNLKSQVSLISSELILNESIFLFAVPIFISFIVSKLGIPVCVLDKYKEESEKAKKEKERLTNLIKERTKELELLATTDMLTEIYNRRKMYEILEHEYTRAKRYGTDLSVIMFDIDYFKKINDTHGHDVGDYVLKTVAKTVKKVIREVDYFGRWGGEEFLIILPQTNLDGAFKAAEKIREVVENIGFGKIGKITASFGVSTYIKELDNSPDELIKSADIALYDAKRKGRNRVSVFNYEYPEENTENKLEVATA